MGRKISSTEYVFSECRLLVLLCTSSMTYRQKGPHYETVLDYCEAQERASVTNVLCVEACWCAPVGRQYLNPDPVTVSLVPPAVLPLLGDISVMSGVRDKVYVNGIVDWDESFPLTTLTPQTSSGPLPMRRDSD